jgi:hypothetical protein
MAPDIGALFQVIIAGVTWYADASHRWRDMRFEASGLVYEIHGA